MATEAPTIVATSFKSFARNPASVGDKFQNPALHLVTWFASIRRAPVSPRINTAMVRPVNVFSATTESSNVLGMTVPPAAARAGTEVPIEKIFCSRPNPPMFMGGTNNRSADGFRAVEAADADLAPRNGTGLGSGPGRGGGGGGGGGGR